MAAQIPRILHQTWKTEQIPPAMQAHAASWKQHHPDWEHRLWTDAMNRDFIRREVPGFLPVYDSYPHAIQRVDAARYFILRHHGGVFVDLDFECLRNIEPLLQDRQFVVGTEPEEHARTHGMAAIVSNAFMASVPGHPLLQRVCEQLPLDEVRHRQRDAGFSHVLHSTGPFMLTRACEAFGPAAGVAILPPALLYPLVKEADGRIGEAQLSSTQHGQAYARHHYWGSWWH